MFSKYEFGFILNTLGILTLAMMMDSRALYAISTGLFFGSGIAFWIRAYREYKLYRTMTEKFIKGMVEKLKTSESKADLHK